MATTTRRAAYTALEKRGQVRPAYVQGMGDVAFKGFQCLSPACQHYMFKRVDEITPDFEIECPSCHHLLSWDGETQFFEYELKNTAKATVVQSGKFVVLHDDYVSQAPLYKHCVLCYTMKHVDMFSKHGARDSGYQSECRSCKTVYNGIKNQTRITDQHREAAQRRRLYQQLSSGGARIDSLVIFNKFGGNCFNCAKKLQWVDNGRREFDLDHTLPAKYLWAMHTGNATLLCSECNNKKHDLWPSEFYDDAKLKRLAVLTGYPYELLAGKAMLNEESVRAIVDDTDAFLETWIHYPRDIKKVRHLIKAHTGIDIFEQAANVPPHLREANEPTD